MSTTAADDVSRRSEPQIDSQHIESRQVAASTTFTIIAWMVRAHTLLLLVSVALLAGAAAPGDVRGESRAGTAAESANPSKPAGSPEGTPSTAGRAPAATTAGASPPAAGRTITTAPASTTAPAAAAAAAPARATAPGAAPATAPGGPAAAAPPATPAAAPTPTPTPTPTPAPTGIPATAPASASANAPAAAPATAPNATATSVQPEAPILTEKGRLLGEVSFTRLEPVVGATVVLTREGDPGRIAFAVTDLTGHFRFEGIPDGTYDVGVVREGAVTVDKKGILVQPPSRAVVDIVLTKDPGRLVAPVFDLARYESPAPADAPAAASTAPPAGSPREISVQVLDNTLKPVREARVRIRSRGPKVDPVRGTTNARGELRLAAPDPGEYSLAVEMPGFLPIRIERLVLGRTAPALLALLTPRPLDFPARPAELLPDERPVPPVGFPGHTEKKPAA